MFREEVIIQILIESKKILCIIFPILNSKKMKALIIVDPQNDFCEGGPLGVRYSEEIFPIINQLKQNGKFSKIFISQDWHPANHMSFGRTHNLEPFQEIEISGEKQMMWPVHCVQGSQGAQVCQLLNLDGSEINIKKGFRTEEETYSAFGSSKYPTQLNKKLKQSKITQVVVVGLALDYCVGSTALDAAQNGYKVSVVSEGTKSVALQTEKVMLQKMNSNNVQYASMKELNL